MKNSTLADRLNEFIETKGLNPSSFGKKIGRPRQSVGDYTSGTKEPGFKVLLDIFLAFPDLNPGWLITGEGEMILKRELSESECKEELRAAQIEVRLLKQIIEEKEKMIQQKEEMIQLLKSQS